MSLQTDRRKSPRFELGDFILLYSPVSASSRGAPAKTWRHGVLRDLAEGGARIEAEETVPKGTPVELEFRFPRFLEVLHTRARTRWSHPKAGRDEGAWEAGLEFKDPPDELVSRIRQLALRPDLRATASYRLHLESMPHVKRR